MWKLRSLLIFCLLTICGLAWMWHTDDTATGQFWFWIYWAGIAPVILLFLVRTFYDDEGTL